MGDTRRARARRRLAATLLFLLCPAAAPAATWVVRPAGNGDFPDLQSAVNGAVDGDTILLAGGTFTGGGNRGVVIDGRDLVIGSLSGAGATEIDCKQADRALLVTGGFVRVSGITFRGGDPAGPGGAIRALGAALTFTDCAFRDNAGTGDVFDAGGGGAIHVTAGRLAVTRCAFTGNRAGSENGIGGAIAVLGGGNATITDSSFDGNETGAGQYAGGGGIVAWDGGDIVVERSAFADNVSVAGVAVFLYARRVRVAGCAFHRNAGFYTAGGISNGIVDFTGCTFEGNPCTALAIHTEAVVTDCVFLRNETPQDGGAILVSGTHATITGSTFAGNRAANTGGAVAISGGPPTEFDRCTFVDNRAASGGSVHARFAPVTLKRCILSGGSGGAVTCAAGGRIAMRCCDVFGNEDGDYVGCLAGRNGTDRNSGADPRFCDPDAGDYALQEGSPYGEPGVPGCGRIGAHPVGCGAVSVEEATWGKIKSWYRE